MHVVIALLFPLTYLIMHEFIHFVAARLLGLSARIYLSSDGILPSLGVDIVEEVNGASRYLVLYSPYVINIIIFLTNSNCFIKVFSLLTLANAVLEEENNRQFRLIIALGILVLMILFLEKYLLSSCS